MLFRYSYISNYIDVVSLRQTKSIDMYNVNTKNINNIDINKYK